MASPAYYEGPSTHGTLRAREFFGSYALVETSGHWEIGPKRGPSRGELRAPNKERPPVHEAAFYCGEVRQLLIYSFGFLCLAARSLHDVVPTQCGGVVLAADRVAIDVGSRTHG
jgi:hypothetical protein